MSTSPTVQVFDLAGLDLEEVRPGFARTGLRTQESSVTVNWFEPDYRSRGQHSHSFDQLSLVLTGTMRFYVGEATHDVAAPGALYIPGDVPHGGEPLGQERVLNVDIFAPVREDYLRLCVSQEGFVDGAAP